MVSPLYHLRSALHNSAITKTSSTPIPSVHVDWQCVTFDTSKKNKFFFVFDFPLLVVCLLTPTCAELTIHHLTLDVLFLFRIDLKVWFQNRRAKFRKQERLTQQKSTDASAAGKESPGETKESRGCSSAGSSAESPHRDLDIKPQMGNFFLFKLEIKNK